MEQAALGTSSAHAGIPPQPLMFLGETPHPSEFHTSFAKGISRF